MRLLIELLAAASSDSSGGGFSVQATLSLVAGSTVLGGIIGAYVQSSRQREEKFRERMIEASVGFLSVIGDAQRAIRQARQAARAKDDPDPATEEAIAKARESVADAWARLPVLFVVFPGREPGDAADKLIQQIEQLVALLDEPHSEDEYQRVASEVGNAHQGYTEVVNRAIRARAFGRGVRRFSE